MIKGIDFLQIFNVKEKLEKMSGEVKEKLKFWTTLLTPVLLIVLVIVVSLLGVSVSVKSGNNMIVINGERQDYKAYVIEQLDEVTASLDALRNFQYSEKLDGVAQAIYTENIETKEDIISLVDNWRNSGWFEWVDSIKDIASNKNLEEYLRTRLDPDVVDLVVWYGRNS